METAKSFYPSPIGIIEITGTAEGVRSLYFVDECFEAEKDIRNKASEVVSEACKQIDEYFKGQRKCFDLKLSLQGTAFQKQVWQQLLQIPYGETISYSTLAEVIGKPSAVRAVGSANGSNPVSVIVPCHRVIGKNGSLTGYGGGLDRKAWLLDFEKRHNI